LAAVLAHAVLARGQTRLSGIDLAQPASQSVAQGRHLSALEPDGRPLRVVLVVGVGTFGGPDDVVELGT
jgi:hypothetical protein